MPKYHDYKCPNKAANNQAVKRLAQKWLRDTQRRALVLDAATLQTTRHLKGVADHVTVVERDADTAATMLRTCKKSHLPARVVTSTMQAFLESSPKDMLDCNIVYFDYMCTITGGPGCWPLHDADLFLRATRQRSLVICFTFDRRVHVAHRLRPQYTKTKPQQRPAFLVSKYLLPLLRFHSFRPVHREVRSYRRGGPHASNMMFVSFVVVKDPRITPSKARFVVHDSPDHGLCFHGYPVQHAQDMLL